MLALSETEGASPVSQASPSAGRWAPAAAAVACSVLLGGTYVASRYAMHYVPTTAVTFARVFIGLISLLLIPQMRAGIVQVSPADGLKVTLLAMLPNGLSTLLINIGLQHTAAARGALLGATVPLWTYGFACLARQERPQLRKLAGVALALWGVAGLEMAEGHGLSIAPGDTLVLLGAVCWAIYNTLGRRLLRLYGAVTFTTYGLASGSLIFLVPAARDLLHESPHIPWNAWLALLYVGLCGGFGTFALYNWALQRASGATQVAVYLNLAPFVAAVLSGIILDEPLRRNLETGMILVCAGATLMLWQGRLPQAWRLGLQALKTAVLHGLGLGLEHLARRGAPKSWDKQSDGEESWMRPGVLVAGRYRLKAILGEGGMGRVWLAEDAGHGRDVALKTRRTGAASERATGRRGEGSAAPQVDVVFRQEFYTMACLTHPHTVQVFDYGRLASGENYFTMEVVEGEDLSALLRRTGALRLAYICRILSQIAHALGFIHSRLYVHCDVKSDNIRIDAHGDVKLMDFGMMHQLGTPAGHTMKGTIEYMAPEIPRGGIVDARTDLYALGVLAFELLTGRFPFTGKSLLDIVQQHLSQPPPKMSKYVDVPEAFETIVQKLLAKEPEQRYLDTNELLADLAQFTGAEPAEQSYRVRTSYLHSARMVGRERDEAMLHEALERMQRAQGQSLLIGAPAGTGKTRLVGEFGLHAKLSDVPFLVGTCRIEGQAALAPLVEVLSQLVPFTPARLLAQHGQILARLLPKLALKLGVAGQPPVLEKGEIVQALQQWLQAVAAAQPFILCLEDLQWADAGSLEYMNVVIRALHQQPAMVLGTMRTDEVDRLSVLFQTVDEGLMQRLELKPFARVGTAAYVASMLPGFSIPEEFLTRLQTATGGNAFFVTETMRMLIERGMLRLDGNRWSLSPAAHVMDLPATIREVVTQRLSALSPEVLEACQKIAPLGTVFTLSLVKEITGLPDDRLFAILDSLVERQFLQRFEAGLHFTHAKVRESIEMSTSPQMQAQCYQRIGEVLEQHHGKAAERHAATLAFYFSRGIDRRHAVQYLLIAARAGLERGQASAAVDLLRQAADLIETMPWPDKWAELKALWARIVEVGITPDPRTCVRYASKLFEQWTQELDLQAAGEVFNARCEQLARLPRWLGRSRLAKLWDEQPLQPHSSSPLHIVPKQQAYRGMQAFCYASMGDRVRLQQTVEQLLQDNPRPGPFRACALTAQAVYAIHGGLWASVADNMHKARAWYNAHLLQIGTLPHPLWRDFAWVHYITALGESLSGKRIDMQVWREGYALSEERRFDDVRCCLYLTTTAHAAVTCDPDAMQKQYDTLVDTVRRIGAPQMLETRSPIYLGMYWLQRREREQADALCRKLEAFHAKVPHDVNLRRYACIYRALYAVDHEEFDVALHRLDVALQAAREEGTHRLLAHLLCGQSRLRWQRGQAAEAKAAAEQALALATSAQTASPWDEMVALRALADALGGEPGMTLAHRCRELAVSLGHPLQEALAMLTLATLAAPADRAKENELRGRAEALLQQLRCKDMLQHMRGRREAS